MPRKLRPGSRRPKAGIPAKTDVGVASAVGAVFRAARETQRLSQYQLAALTEGPGAVSRGTISDIERGKNLPSLEHLVILTSVLHIEPAEVLERVRLSIAPPVDLTDHSMDGLRARAEELFWTGDYRGALAVYDAMVERLVLDPPSEDVERRTMLGQLEVNRAATLRKCSAINAAAASAKRAVEVTEGIPEVQARAYTVLASLETHEGNLVLARALTDQAIALADACGDRTRGLAWIQKGRVLHTLRQFKEAQRAFHQARDSLRRAGDLHNLSQVEGNIGSCLIELGRPVHGKKQLVRAVEIAREQGDHGTEASWIVELGSLALRQGNPEEADRLAREALRIARPAERVLTVFRAEWVRHLAVVARDPAATDKGRLLELRKLYARVQEHKTLDAVQEFEARVLNAGKEGDGGDDA